MTNFTRKQIAEAIDKYQTEHPLFAPMMYDVTSLPDIESADCITNEIRKYQDKIAEETEMWLICEMAKMYMQGVVPHYTVEEKPKCEREFVEIITEYHEDDYDTLPEYRGKPYYSIHYRENGEEFVGYGTYKIEVLSDYLRKYFFGADMRGENDND